MHVNLVVYVRTIASVKILNHWLSKRERELERGSHSSLVSSLEHGVYNSDDADGLSVVQRRL